MEICNINKNRIKTFINSLTYREENDFVTIEDKGEFVMQHGDMKWVVKTFTLNFSGAHGNWDDLINKVFKTNKD
jgi:hypothetical protein